MEVITKNSFIGIPFKGFIFPLHHVNWSPGEQTTGKYLGTPVLEINPGQQTRQIRANFSNNVSKR